MAGTTHPIKLLIVDDDEDMRQDLSRLFRKQGHEVATAVSSEDALNKAAHARFDVALLDLHLPGISGIDVLVKLKEQQPELERGHPRAVRAFSLDAADRSSPFAD